MLGSLVLRLRAGQHCQCQLLRSLVTHSIAQSPAEAALQQEPASGHASWQSGGCTKSGFTCMSWSCTCISSNTGAADSEQQQQQQRPNEPAWWSDRRVNAKGAYMIIKKRLALHGSQSESQYALRCTHIDTFKGCYALYWHAYRRRKLQATLQQGKET